MTSSIILIAANGCFTKKNIRLFQRLKMQVLVSEVSFVKRKKSLSFGIGRYLHASHEVNMPYLT